MTDIGIILNHRKRSFDLVVSPYYQSKEIVCATKLNGDDIACRPEDLFQIEGIESKVDFFMMVRDSFTDPMSTVAKSVYDSFLFTILNGVCTLHLSSDMKFITQFTLEKGIKINENAIVSYDAYTNSYLVKTTDSFKRKMRYETKQPRGASYDRVLLCLRQGALTTTEIAHLLGVPENRISGRLSEMDKCGLVRKSGYKTVEGRRQTIWALVRKDKKSKMTDWNLE